MIEFGGIYYYIDFERFESLISANKVSEDELTTTTTTTTTTDGNGMTTSTTIVKNEAPKPKEINVANFEMVRELIDVILSHDEEGDTSLGAERVLSQAPLSFKIAFNTLYEYGIIKEKE
jgi:hypothetical protein